MANVAFSGLTAVTALQRADLLCITDDSEGAVEKTKKITFGTLQDALIVKGSFVRPQFTWSSATSLLIGAGFYDVDGKYASWAGQLTETLSGLAANTRYYVYLDYSAITSGTAVTATEIIVSSTAPTYSHTKVGWYNGSDRCIFGFATESATTAMREFFHSGEQVNYANQYVVRALTALTNGWVDVDMSTVLPAFATGLDVTFYLQGFDNTASYIAVYWRTNGQTGTTGHQIGSLDKQNSVITNHFSQEIVHSDSSQIIEVKASANNQKLGVYVNGWNFPIGM